MSKSILEPVHLSCAESIEFGKAQRTAVPRHSHAKWEPTPGRSNPIDLLKEQAKTREQSLVPIRYERMSVSPFT
ncbi:MAG: DUF2252 domain-containing protein, partial [Clostridia bacterium]